MIANQESTRMEIQARVTAQAAVIQPDMGLDTKLLVGGIAGVQNVDLESILIIQISLSAKNATGASSKTQAHLMSEGREIGRMKMCPSLQLARRSVLRVLQDFFRTF